MPDHYSVKLATLDDILDIQNIMIKTWRETYQNYIAAQGELLIEKEISTLFSLERIHTYLNDENHKLWVAQDFLNDNYMFGFIHLILNKSNPTLIFLDQIYLDNDYQGMGLGKKLFSFCEKYAIKNQYENIELEVDVENHKALAFYTKSGFSTIDKKLYPTENNSLYYNYLMRKSLQPQKKHFHSHFFPYADVAIKEPLQTGYIRHLES